MTLLFDNQRYVTRGVLDKVPVEQVNLIWAIIDVRLLSNPKLNYLQIFRLDVADKPGTQLITHTHENPSYKNEIRGTVEKVVCADVFVIDNGTCSTMMLSSEY